MWDRIMLNSTYGFDVSYTGRSNSSNVLNQICGTCFAQVNDNQKLDCRLCNNVVKDFTLDNRKYLLIG